MGFGGFKQLRSASAYVLLASLFVSSFLLSTPRQVEAAPGINQQLNFQGRLLTAQGATVPDGLYNIQFKIYQDGDGLSVGNTTGSPAGSLKWTENHLNANGKGVVVKNGYLSVQLGSITAFGSSIDWNQDTLWLSMNVGNTNATCTPVANCALDGEMVPMKRLSSTPFAMNSAMLGGITASGFIQSTTSPQSANIAVQSANAASVAALIQGASGQTANLLNLRAGSGELVASTSATGALQLQNSVNSSAAFSVKNSAGSSLVTADTATMAFGIGTAVPSTTLHVETANSSTDKMQLLVKQTGTGDAGIALSTTGQTFYMGVDASDSNSFKLSSDSVSSSAVNVGNNTVYPNTDSAINTVISNTQFTAPASGTISQVRVYVSSTGTAPYNKGIAGIYNSQGTTTPIPYQLQAQSPEQNLTPNAWNTFTLASPVSVISGQRYWLSYTANGVTSAENNPVYQTGAPLGTSCFHTYGYNGSMPSSISTGQCQQTSVYYSYGATLQTSGGGAGDILSGSLMRVSGTGQTTFKNSTNSSTAFRVQNASGVSVLSTDTSNSKVTIGNVTSATGEGLAGSLVLADGTTSNFGVTVNSATLTANRTITLPNESGTVCLQSSANCGFLTSTAGVQLQASTPGTAQTGNFNITGTGIAGILQSASMIVTGSSGTAEVTLGSASNNGLLTFKNSTNSNLVSIQGGVTTSSYTTILPTAIGTVGQCLTVSNVAGSVQNLGYTGCLTSANSIELQASTPGTAQTGNFNINGTGIVGTRIQTPEVTAGSDQSLALRGGNASVTNTNGGNVTIVGGAGNGTGVAGIVNLGASAYMAVTNTSCAADCTIAQANVDSYGTVIVNASTSSIVITLPAPTNATLGRTVYITTASGSQDFTLRTNTGINQIDVAMRQNTTSTMIWNGTAWTPGGASNATTLQATYNNGTNPSTTPEIKLDNIRGTIDIQDADTTIGTDLFTIRGSNPAGLGTVLFGVSNTGRVTIQDTSDTSSSFRVLNSNGDYLLNVNGSSNYTFNNTIRSIGNEIANPNFESGGAITGGEAGWFGPAQASIINSAANSHGGNYQLQVTANSSPIDVYAGTYYEVVPGQELYLEAWVKNNFGASGNAGIKITWFDKDKNVISTSTDNSSTPGAAYILKRVTGTAPSGASFARVSASLQASTSGTFYFDDFYLKRSGETSPFTFRNAVDTTAAFRIQSAGSAQTLFTADTTSNILRVGDASGTDTQTTLLVLDSATADPTTSLSTRNGGLFYRSDTNSLKAVIGGVVVDVCTTAVTCNGYSASAGASIQLQGSSPGSPQTGNFNITGTGILTQLQTMDRSTPSTSSSNLTIRTGNATGTSSSSGNITIDVGTATSTPGTIAIGRTGVATTVGGTLAIQGSNSLSLGQSSSAIGSILFNTSANTGTITLRAPGANVTSYNLTLPTALGGAGECIKTDATGGMYFQGCGVGVNFNLQDAYNNSGTPATVLLADAKDLQFVAQDTATTDPNVVVDLQCAGSCGTNGKFVVKTTAGEVFSVLPNTQGIRLNTFTQVGSSITDGTQTNFQLDSYNGGTDSGTCNATTNQGAMYYNTAMGSLRACLNGAWGDVSNPDTLGLLTFGIVPSSGAHPYDLPALVTTGASGPCKVSWASQTSVVVQPCTAYSNGRRFNIDSAVTLNTNSAVAPHINLTTANRWGHICLDSTSGQPIFTTTAGQASALAGLPNFNVSQPILCLADVQGESTTAGRIDNIYDTRTFTSTMKEAVSASTALELGMLADAGTTGMMVPATSASAKLYGATVATNGGTSSGTPNVIVATVGAAWVKATAGTAGQFIRTSTTAGHGDTVSAIPNNSFYYSVGNTRTAYSTTCTAASNCAGSLYVNFIVR